MNSKKEDDHNHDPLISIVVPVYNIRDYLSKCLDSILSQTYKRIEVLLIDDGSKDGSENICDDYAEQDPRVRVYHCENQGAAAARNRGIDKSTGAYIAFIDGDDYVVMDYIEKLYKELKAKCADAAICGCVIDKNGVIKEGSSSLRLDGKVITGEEAVFDYYKNNRTIYISPWSKLFNIQVFDKIRFPNGKLKEDAYFFPILYGNLGKIACLSDRLYYYVERKGSATHGSINENELKHRIGYRQYHYSYYKAKGNRCLECMSWLAYCEYLSGIYKLDGFEDFGIYIKSNFREICNLRTIFTYWQQLTVKKRLKLILCSMNLELYAMLHKRTKSA